ncbi:peptidyl-prolyl cis-trans isomerase [Aureimonas endophytica]|uniref:Peptidyl-prolyl cis-trans isomerase n=1 Tax=Aureimonas endophytica TaxID=2027858 RepID=A0A916ZDU7_9HYPH|nr:peptidylprolyl isomerase [Aureimonas endophytica]GGD88798.1 peptidyl-prolyl cis-trans isomerase [Aureimonas endophytica]
MTLLGRLGLSAAIGLAALVGPVAAASAKDMMVITTKDGEIDVALRPDLAPNHVKQIEALAKRGFYDGIVFHRVIDGFMAQTGDPTGTGMGGSDLPDIKAEFSKQPFKRGTVGMARAADPNSANSQFFIMLADGSFLNGQYTVVGEVTKGMDVVDKIKKGDAKANGTVNDPDKMVSVKIVQAK